MRAYSRCLATNRVGMAAVAAICMAMALGVAGCAHILPGSPLSESSHLELPPDAFIHVGMSVEGLKSLVGEPVTVEKTEREWDTEVWHYDFGVVLIEGGQVRYKYPPSRVVTDSETLDLP